MNENHRVHRMFASSAALASFAILVACSSSSETGVDAPDAAANGSAITGLAPGVWTWVAFPDARCRDGSSTGMGVNPGPSSDKLVIFLEGGGACFNATTCAGNPSKFGADDFAALADTTCGGQDVGHKCLSVNDGIFDRANPANPVRDWSYVYIPYCTGDIHSGNRADEIVAGVAGTQQFVGYWNLGLFLARIVPTFSTSSRVLLTGASAGGFGVAANYLRVARAFGSTRVDLVDDSGPPMEDPYLATCLQTAERQLWGLDDTILKDCGAACASPASLFLDLYRLAVRSYPSAAFGQLSATDDSSTSQYLGFGVNDCSGFAPLTEAQMMSGLADLRTQLAAYSNSGSFYFAGTAHTSLQSAAFYTRAAGGDTASTGVALPDWIAALLRGDVENVGPDRLYLQL